MDKPIVKERNFSIEAWRAIAIILVVLGHVIGSGPSNGMKIEFPSFGRYFYLYCDYIQLPLFTMIAGWTFGLANPARRIFKSFFNKKFERLLIPLVVVSTIYFITQYYTPGTNDKGELSEIWRIYIFPYTIYWYLQSLFVIYLLAFVLDKLKIFSNITSWVACLVISFAAMSLSKEYLTYDITPDYFSFKGALLQLPYFIIGVGLIRFKELLNTKFVKYFSIILTLGGISLLQYRWFFCSPTDIFLRDHLQPYFAAATAMLCLSIKLSNKLLIKIGAYTYSIYLLHVFFTAGIRIILTKLGFTNPILTFTLASFFAVSIPILIEIVARRNKITRFLLTGCK